MNDELELVLYREQVLADERHPINLATFRGVNLGLIYDALRLARDNFRDENGLRFSLEENAVLQEVIDLLDEHIEP
ncbi:MAG TPA: hypothetical protein VGQ76_07300 [Thermoanaerobaculia bacterium]|jgi:hypothetical protein|nr:hypothetical protein [Thermoanaerobaculia bacterium]